MEIVSSIVKDQLNRFIIEMGDSAMKKKTIIISGIAAVLVIGSVVFCFAVKGDSTQSAEVAQTVTEAVATPTIEIPEEVVEELEVVEEVTEVEVAEEVTEVEVAEEPEVVEETPEVEETSSEVSPEEVKPAETKPVEAQPQQTKTEPNVNQISTDEASQALINQILANGGSIGIPEGVNISESGNVTSSSAGAGVTLE